MRLTIISNGAERWARGYSQSAGTGGGAGLPPGMGGGAPCSNDGTEISSALDKSHHILTKHTRRGRFLMRGPQTGFILFLVFF